MAAPSLKPDWLPIFYYGDNFLPLESVKKWVREQERVVLQTVTGVEDLKSAAQLYAYKLVVLHVSHPRQNSAVAHIIQALGSDFVGSTASLIVITGSNNRALKRLLGSHAWVEMLPSEVDALQLRSKISMRLRALRDRASMKRFEGQESSAEVAGTPSASAASIYLIKGEKPANVSAVQEAPAEAAAVSFKDSLPEASEAAEPFANKPIFEPIRERTEIHSLMEECLKTKAPLSVFDPSMSQRGTVEIIGLDTRSNTIRFKQGFKAGPGGLEQLTEGLSTGLLGNFNLRRGRIFFRAAGVRVDGAEGSMPLPEVVFEVQRRANLRLPLSDSQLATLRVDGQASTRKGFEIVDVSSGGLCLLVDGTTVQDWKSSETRLKEIEFKVGSRHLRVAEAEVRHMAVFDKRESGTTYRVGLRFVDISVRDHCFINAFIYSESQKYLDQMFAHFRREA